MKSYLLIKHGLLNSIMEKMPWLKGPVVKIQHYEARPHTGVGLNASVESFGLADGWKFKFHQQPVQSPELNILDLGLFTSLKTRVWKLKGRALNIDDLITKVIQAYSEYDVNTLDNIWCHLYTVYNQILVSNGDNQFKEPHCQGRTQQKKGWNFS